MCSMEFFFRAEDIRISVIRPSPVKEVPQKVGEDREEKTDADVSENTSGSSIQVGVLYYAKFWPL